MREIHGSRITFHASRFTLYHQITGLIGTRKLMNRYAYLKSFLSPVQRRSLFIAQIGVLAGYLITNRLLSHLGGGTTFEIWLDRYVPFWPIWVVPYSLALVWWGAALLWAYLHMEDRLYAAFVTGWISTCLIGYSFFILYPNYMVRPEVTGAGWAEWLMRFVYANDRTYNAFPIQHLWSTVIITLFWSRWRPRWRWPLWGFTGIVALSTRSEEHTSELQSPTKIV